MKLRLVDLREVSRSRSACPGPISAAAAVTRVGRGQETRSLVFKKVQSSARPEVLEQLMDTGQGVSESP